MFLTSDAFDKGMIYLIRSMASNFLLSYRDRSFNELPFEVAFMADAVSIEEYIENILMKMNEDA